VGVETGQEGAFPGKLAGNLEADAAGTAGNEYVFAGKSLGYGDVHGPKYIFCIQK
jgi:hypothetical protein